MSSKTKPRLLPVRRLLTALLWYGIPGLAALAVAAYIVGAIVWHANPPAIPVAGVSMRPTLQPGDLVFLKGVDPERLRKGDIVAVRVPSDARSKYGLPGAIAHRIVRVNRTPNGLVFVTKGDANAGNDVFTTPAPDVIGREVAAAHGLGYPFLFFRSRQGYIFVAALIVVGILYFLLGVFEERRAFSEGSAVAFETILAETVELRRTIETASGEAASPPPREPGASAETREIPPASGTIGAAAEEPAYVPVWERQRRPHERLAEYELAPAYAERAVVPGEIDFDRLEREIHQAVRSSADVKETMRELVGAIGEYGEHLQSHTAVMQSLAAATGDLQATTSEMREFLASLTVLLRSLVEQRNPS